jgi:hypothetical protein
MSKITGPKSDNARRKFAGRFAWVRALGLILLIQNPPNCYRKKKEFETALDKWCFYEVIHFIYINSI